MSGNLKDPSKCVAFVGQGKVEPENMYYTYVLLCQKQKLETDFYIGFTDDLKNRVNEHKAGEIQTPRKFDKVDLIYYEACLDKADARKRELQLKTGFGKGYLKRRLEGFLKGRI